MKSRKMQVSPAQLRSLRSRRGWTQGQLGERLDVSTATISRWEAGLRMSWHQEWLSLRLEQLTAEAEVTIGNSDMQTDVWVDPDP